jgi:hypothetical protein
LVLAPSILFPNFFEKVSDEICGKRTSFRLLPSLRLPSFLGRRNAKGRGTCNPDISLQEISHLIVASIRNPLFFSWLPSNNSRDGVRFRADHSLKTGTRLRFLLAEHVYSTTGFNCPGPLAHSRRTSLVRRHSRAPRGCTQPSAIAELPGLLPSAFAVIRAP